MDPITQGKSFSDLLYLRALIFLLLELISDCLAKLSGKKIATFRLVCFLILSLVSLFVLNKKGIYTFAYAAQPYSMSFLLMGWS